MTQISQHAEIQDIINLLYPGLRFAGSGFDKWEEIDAKLLEIYDRQIDLDIVDIAGHRLQLKIATKEEIENESYKQFFKSRVALALRFFEKAFLE